MKKIISALLVTMTLVMSMGSANAHGFYGGGWHGGFRGGRGIGFWPLAAGAAVVGATAAVVGNSLAYATRPVYNSYPGVVYQQPAYVAAAPAPVHYFCPNYQAFYPQVPSCPSPWQLVQ